MTDMVEMTQSARDAFAAMCEIQGGPNVMPSYVRMGQADDHPGVQAFAAAEQRGFKRCQGMVEAAIDEARVGHCSTIEHARREFKRAIRTLSIKETGNGE